MPIAMRPILTSTLAFGLLALLAACGSEGDRREVLTIYSPHGRDVLKAFEAAYEKAHPTVDVQFVDLGSQEILDRLRSEKANPQADVWFGAPAYTFAQAVGDSLLEPYTPTWAGAVAADSRDPKGYWTGTYLTPEVIAYNAKRVTAADAPKDWDEVLDPRWKGKVLIRDPMASGTMRTIFGMFVQRSIRQTGDTAQAWGWLRRLDGQTKEYVLNPTLLYQKLAREEGLVTLWDLPDLEELRARSSLPIAYVLPRSGTPVVVDAIAVVKGTAHGKLARDFVEWVGAPEQQVMAATQFFRLPARTDVPDSALPEPLRRAKAQLRAEPMDWARFEKDSPGWMRYWDQNVRRH
jgi:iron(III) transport system substrate-binding protein